MWLAAISFALPYSTTLTDGYNCSLSVYKSIILFWANRFDYFSTLMKLHLHGISLTFQYSKPYTLKIYYAPIDTQTTIVPFYHSNRWTHSETNPFIKQRFVLVIECVPNGSYTRCHKVAHPISKVLQ